MVNGNEIITLIATIASIVSFFIGFSISKVSGIKQNQKRKKILSVKSKTCTITIPHFNVQIFNDVSNVLLLEESILQHQIIELCHKVRINTKIYSNELDIVGDEIHIGGPTTNTFVNSYFHTYFKNFKWLTTQEHFNRYAKKISDQLHLSVIQINNSDNKEGFLVNNDSDIFFERIENIQDVAVLVKMTSSDVNVGHKNIHMLFGVGRIGTKAAVNYFAKCYNELYKEHKGKHYFLVFLVSKKTGLPLDKPIDLSDIMFS